MTQTSRLYFMYILLLCLWDLRILRLIQLLAANLIHIINSSVFSFQYPLAAEGAMVFSIHLENQIRFT